MASEPVSRSGPKPDKAQGTKVRCRSGKGSSNDSVTEGVD